MTKNQTLLIDTYKSLDTDMFGKPSSPGVYFVCIINPQVINKEERIVYIGCSKNIQKRLSDHNHPYKLLYNRFHKCLVYTRSLITSDYIRLEKEYIKLFRPLLNKSYKK